MLERRILDITQCIIFINKYYTYDNGSQELKIMIKTSVSNVI